MPTISDRPAPRNGNPFSLTPEAGGFVLACACRWLKFYPTRSDSDAGRREHEKRCKVARGEAE